MGRVTPDEDRLARSVILIEQLLEAARGKSLPSVRTIAASNGLTIAEVTAAAHVLRGQGKIEYRRGGRIRPFSQHSRAEEPNSAVRFKAMLVDRIRNAELRSGLVLDKIGVWALKHHVSRSTVSKVLRELQSESLVHKTGRAWVVGPPILAYGANDKIPFISSEAPVMLMLCRDESTLLDVITRRTQRFHNVLEEESLKYGVQVTVAHTRGAEIGAGDGSADRISETILSYGKRFLGTIYFDKAHEEPEIEHYLPMLRKTGKPTIWFDRFDKVSRPPGDRLFTVCYYSEEAFVGMAIHALCQAGHTKVIYAADDLYNAGGWQYRRFELLRSLGKASGLTVEGVGAKPTGEEIIPDSVADGLPPAPRTWWRDLVERVLKVKGATALIAPNDYAASRYYKELIRRGIRIPEQLSIVSFDNSFRLRSAPVSSVDAGFGHLGYCALHLLLGLIPVRRDQSGNIPARPYLVDRGSIALVHR